MNVAKCCRVKIGGNHQTIHLSFIITWTFAVITSFLHLSIARTLRVCHSVSAIGQNTLPLLQLALDIQRTIWNTREEVLLWTENWNIYMKLVNATIHSLFLRPPPHVKLHAVHSDHSVHTGHGFSEHDSVSSESPEHFRLDPKVLHSLKNEEPINQSR